MKYKLAIKNSKFYLLLIFIFSLSACSFKAKTLANDPTLNSDLLKRKATVLGPPPSPFSGEGLEPETPPWRGEGTRGEASDSAEASNSAETEESEQRAKDLALNHVFQMEEYKDGKGENLKEKTISKKEESDCENCYDIEIQFDLTDESLSAEEKKITMQVELENWEVKSSEIQEDSPS